MKGYAFVDTLDFTPFRREVHFHTFQLLSCRTHHVWHPSRFYMQNIKPKKSVGVEDSEETYRIDNIPVEEKGNFWNLIENEVRKKIKDEKQKIQNPQTPQTKDNDNTIRDAMQKIQNQKTPQIKNNGSAAQPKESNGGHTVGPAKYLVSPKEEEWQTAGPAKSRVDSNKGRGAQVQGRKGTAKHGNMFEVFGNNDDDDDDDDDDSEDD